MQRKLNVAICEDEENDADCLCECIHKSGIEADYTVFSNGNDFLKTFRPGIFDVIFMDIYLNETNGVKVASKIREADEDIIIAFTTTSTEHTLESYRLGALKYLEKPIQSKDIKETLELALLKRKTSAYISLLTGGRYEDIPLSSIIYFENRNHAVMVNTTNGTFRTSQTVKLSYIETLLPFPPFFRCHQSYIVNLRFVRDLDKEFKVFTMKNGSKVYIIRRLLKQASVAFENYLFDAARDEQ